MSSWRQQALIEAPVGAVWEMVGNPNSYPDWATDVLEVTGLPSVERGTTFGYVGKGPTGSPQPTTMLVEELEELREIRLRCERTGYYAHWRLVEAQGSTFADVEVGMQPTAFRYSVVDATLGKRWYRSIVDRALTGLRSAVGPSA